MGLLVDERIQTLHAECVQTAVKELETFTATRVRKNNTNSHRVTNNIIAGVFQHDTSRASDPMIHSHCVVFNATYDPVEQRWKALEKLEMLRSIRYINKVYEHELCRGLKKLGYGIEQQAKQFEITGFTRELIEKFSKRHQEIINKTQTHLAKKGLTANSVEALHEQVRLDTRRKKDKAVTARTLKASWEEQLTLEEKAILIAAKQYTRQEGFKVSAEQAMDFAKNHWFERNATGKDYELWTLALERYLSEDFSVEQLKSAFAQNNFLKNAQNQWEVTTPPTLACEAYLIEATQNGIGQWDTLQGRCPCTPPGSTILDLSLQCKALHVGSRDESLVSLFQEQEAAIQTILGSKDFVTLFRGAAGTGKSHTIESIKGHFGA